MHKVYTIKPGEIDQSNTAKHRARRHNNIIACGQSTTDTGSVHSQAHAELQAPSHSAPSPRTMDSMGSSRVAVLVVALGLTCLHVDSFVLPAQPIIALPTSTTSVGRPALSAPAPTLSRGSRSTRMMAGALDVSLALRMGGV